MRKRILVIDVGGTHVKRMMSRTKKRKLQSGSKMRHRGHMPYVDDRFIEDFLGKPGIAELGEKEWERLVVGAVAQLKKSFIADYVVLGGGNTKKLSVLPEGAEQGHNRNAYLGGVRLWQTDQSTRRPKWRVL